MSCWRFSDTIQRMHTKRSSLSDTLVRALAPHATAKPFSSDAGTLGGLAGAIDIGALGALGGGAAGALGALADDEDDDTLTALKKVLRGAAIGGVGGAAVGGLHGAARARKNSEAESSRLANAAPDAWLRKLKAQFGRFGANIQMPEDQRKEMVQQVASALPETRLSVPNALAILRGDTPDSADLRADIAQQIDSAGRNMAGLSVADMVGLGGTKKAALRANASAYFFRQLAR